MKAVYDKDRNPCHEGDLVRDCAGNIYAIEGIKELFDG